MARGDGPFLDRFFRSNKKEESEVSLKYGIGQSRGHYVSRYPIATAILLVPIILPQVWIFDRARPGWDDPHVGYYGDLMAKHATALLMAVSGVVLLALLRSLGHRGSALVATLAAGLGSDYWVVASQSPWQHGPAALALTCALWIAVQPTLRASLLGISIGLLICFRLTDIFPALALLLWVAWDRPRQLPRVLGPMILTISPLVVYNYYYFGTIMGGQAALEAMHEKLHNTNHVWNLNPIPGFLGTLFSPSRGLFLFCPWVVFAVTYGLVAIKKSGCPRPIASAIASLAPHTLMLSCYSVWWAGWSFGPRYWTDVTPLFAILLAAGLDRAQRTSRVWYGVALVTIIVSMIVQAIGAFHYPSGWEESPNSVDLHHERLWDWSDNELRRCIEAGPFRSRR